MKQKHFTSNEIKIHNELLNIFHSVENKRYANHLGPKIFGQFQRFALLILYKRSGKSLRRFTQELCESKWVNWLQLREIPSKSTLHSWIKQANVAIFRKYIQYFTQESKLLAIDATGFDSWQRSRHYERRIGTPHMPYAKVDVLVDTETKIIYDFVLRTKPRHDTLGATSIFKRNKIKAKVLGDKGYDSEPLHEIARQNGLELYAPVRKSDRKKPRGYWRKRCAEPDEQYSRRNIVESVIHALKCMVPALRSRLHYMKKREMALGILVYNIERKIKVCFYVFFRSIHLNLDTIFNVKLFLKNLKILIW
ncbi:MAG: transposase [Candidatus Woesearchaeota archaeon]